MNQREQLIDAGVRLLQSGCTIETWGNISLIDRENSLIYITPSGMDYTTMGPDDICICDLNGTLVEGTRKPSVELGLHLAVYASRPEVGCVLHTHPIYSTIFSCMGEDIPPLIDEAAQALGDVVRTTTCYALPASQALADQCIMALGQSANACLLQSHGAVCVGKDLKGAFKVSTVLEATAQIYHLIRATGGTPKVISPEDIAAMQYFATNCYGQK